MSSKLPPSSTIPAIALKNIKEEWESNRRTWETRLSEAMGVPWTFDFVPSAIWPHAVNTVDGRERPGHILNEYGENAMYSLSFFVGNNNYSDVGKTELNKIIYTHTIELAVAKPNQLSENEACGCDVANGRLRILFSANRFGVNPAYALESIKLIDALQSAPPAPNYRPALSVKARLSIGTEYYQRADEAETKLRQILDKPGLTLDPNFKAVFAKLKSSREAGYIGWEDRLGVLAGNYFVALAAQLEAQKFGVDDVLREGLNEVVTKGVVRLRVVDQLQRKTYNEVVIEDGILYMQTLPKYFDTNINVIGEDTINLL